MKIAAFDYDGTLYRDGVIAGDVIRALAAWRRMGNLAVSATGKSISSIRRTLQPYDLEMDYHLVCNGAAVTSGNFKPLHGEYLPREAVVEIAQHFYGRRGLNIYALTLDGVDALLWKGVVGIQTDVVPQTRALAIGEVRDVALLAVWAPGNPAVKEEVVSWGNSHFDFDTSMNTDFFDIMPPGRNKGSGLQWLITYLGLKRSEVELYTFGDGNNDLSMHEIADVSFSFPYAASEVRDSATYVVKDVVEGMRFLMG